MNCSEAQDVLSAFYDGDLPDDWRAQVAVHVDECPDCARSLETFSQLSAMTALLDSPQAPEQLWNQTAKQLDEDKVNIGASRQKWLTSQYIALAASLLIAVGFAWYAVGTWTRHDGHAEFVAEIGHYLETFHRDPEAAQHLLLAKYDAQTVTADEAARRVGYRPVRDDEMPDGFSLESTYMVSMPCCRKMDHCTCVQTVCRRDDGSMITIFEHGGAEHGEEKPEMFGGRRPTFAQCGGKACSLVQIEDRIAASWMRGERHVTVIGVRDFAELEQLATALN